tara:strand:+ start:71 stop:592 length:522 start_codon:yes stop_codon:yes gene_type:complete
MKIDVKQIIFDYFGTVRGERWTVASTLDLVLIFGTPALAGYLTYYFRRDLGEDLFLSLFTLFGVFIAVFMAIQGVLVALYDTKRATSKDEAVDKRLELENLTKRKLIREISFSLSYLKLFSLLSMSLLIVPIASNSNLFLFDWISIALACHLILNLLVILKRLHALFSHQFTP